jgi:hypothetical protein
MNLLFLGLILIASTLEGGIIKNGPNRAVLIQSANIATDGPDACTNTGAGGSWTNTSNATTDNDTFSTVALVGASRFLTCTDYDVGIPAGATIVGIKLEVDRKSDANDIQDFGIQLTKDGTAAVGDDKAAAGNWPTTSAFATYGGESDLWGTTWTAAEVNAITFGSLVRATTGASDTASVDTSRFTIYYTL